MNQYIKDLVETIHNSDMTTTYKMSWCRSLVERSVKNPSEKVIYLKDLSPMIFKYYWNQSIFFNLNHKTKSQPTCRIFCTGRCCKQWPCCTGCWNAEADR